MNPDCPSPNPKRDGLGNPEDEDERLRSAEAAVDGVQYPAATVMMQQQMVAAHHYPPQQFLPYPAAAAGGIDRG
ncbi:hypothetical protein MRB53_015169 [Persea americana]|uniref:Uncharacterized protein n=1 Tax=Persea americana TaxID=3435 RepID=A0ACC2KD28_PERAE|nr:hypothetical protein MRB53_015169 [Persea americana]